MFDETQLLYLKRPGTFSRTNFCPKCFDETGPKRERKYITSEKIKRAEILALFPERCAPVCDKLFKWLWREVGDFIRQGKSKQ